MVWYGRWPSKFSEDDVDLTELADELADEGYETDVPVQGQLGRLRPSGGLGKPTRLNVDDGDNDVRYTPLGAYHFEVEDEELTDITDDFYEVSEPYRLPVSHPWHNLPL